MTEPQVLGAGRGAPSGEVTRDPAARSSEEA
jgi:hypothetical protein